MNDPHLYVGWVAVLVLPLLIMDEGGAFSAADCVVLDEREGVVFGDETADRLELDEEEVVLRDEAADRPVLEDEEVVTIRDEGATFLAVDCLPLDEE
jgi:hypothetical protein